MRFRIYFYPAGTLRSFGYRNEVPVIRCLPMNDKAIDLCKRLNVAYVVINQYEYA